MIDGRCDQMTDKEWERYLAIDLLKRIKNEETHEREIDRRKALDLAIKALEQPKVGDWIPADEPPKNDDYILLSFYNFSGLMIGRYDTDEEGNGAYYLGDCCEEDTCVANDLFVNAWQPLPEPYNPGTVRKQTNGDRIRAMSDEDLALNMMCPNENGLAEIDCDKSDNCNCYECLLKWLRSEME